MVTMMALLIAFAVASSLMIAYRFFTSDGSPPPPPPPPPHTTTMTDVSLEKQEDFPIHSHSLMVAITTTPEEDAMSMQIRHRIISQVVSSGCACVCVCVCVFGHLISCFTQ